MAERLEGQIDIKATKTQKELDKLIKKLERIENTIDDVSRSTLDPKVRERRIESLNKQLKVTEASLRRLKGQKIDIQTTKPGVFDRLQSKLIGVKSALNLMIAAPIVQGLAQLAAGMINLGAQASEITKLKTGIDDYIKSQGILTAGGGLATQKDFTDQLTESTKKLVKESNSLILVNEALNKGIATSPEQYAKLSQAAAVLGQTVGKDAVTSIQSVNTALANNSKEVLENIGVVLSVSEAQEALAQKYGKTVNQLTALEKAQAFQIIGSERIIQKAQEMGGASTLVVTGTDRMAAAQDRATLALGRLIESPVNSFLLGLAERLETVAGLTDVWGDNISRLNDVVTAMAGTDLGLEGVSGGVQRQVLEMDLTALDQAIQKEKDFLSVAEQMGATQVSIVDANERLANLEAERLATAEKLASLTPPDQISPNVNQGIAQALELQKQQQVAEQAITKETGERIALLKTLQALQKQGFLSAESYSEQLLNKEQSVADLRLFTEQAVRNAQVQTHANKINQLNEVAAKTQEVAQLEATIEAKKIEAVASFEKRRNQFYANEAKRIAEARKQGLAGLAGGLVSDVTGELGGLFGVKEENISRDIAENARRLAAVAAGDLSGESAQLLKESGFWEKMFGTETDPSIIQAKAQEIGQSLVSGFDQFGLIDAETAADKIVNMITGTGAGEGASIQDAIMAELETRGLSPELLDKAFNITRQEFGEELDISLVGENERQRITELNEEIKKLGDDGQIALDKLGDATGDIEKQSEVWDFALDEKIARYERILELMGMIAGTDPGVFGMGATEGPPPPPQAGGTSPVSPDTSFTIPTAPLPTADFVTPEIATSNATPQNQPQAQAGGQVMRGNINATIMMDGQAVANQVIPYVARAIR